MNKKILIILALAVFLISVMVVKNVSAVGEVSFCCEKTKTGAFCQNAPETECVTTANPSTGQPYQKSPTSCEATSFCRLGCCYDSQEGTCAENTPLSTCNANGGVYSGESASCDIAQCALGCCLLGDQAAFVTQVRCKQLSGDVGLETNFRSDITDEASCLATATSDVKGACVFEKDFQRTCRLLTQKECKNLESSTEGVEFHAGFLCSAEELGTNCGPTTKTTCVEERDEVYFVDSCGNLGNIYDSNKEKDKLYWTEIVSKPESCNPDGSNANSASCGNCDYFLGSTCKTYDKNKDARPVIGNNICRDLSCEYEGDPYQHGETWCVNNGAEGAPGSEYFRLVCYNGEVTVEPCAAFRGERCIEDETNEGYRVAACRVNRWQDCFAQENERDCTNTDKRECEWINSGGLKQGLSEDDIKDFTDEVKDGNDATSYYQFVCVPKYSPGFDFWEAGSDAENMCSIANAEATVTYKEKFGGGEPEKVLSECQGNCQFITEYFESTRNNLCLSLGDCGDKKNFLNIWGFNHEESPIKCNGEDCPENR